MTDPHRERRRFWTRVRPASTGCWLWIGGTRANGYGKFAVKPGRRWTGTTAHRWAYTDLVGPIPDGYEVDHLCRVRACVRSDHLEVVTVAENRRRRDIKYAPAVDRAPRPLPAIPSPPPAPVKRNRLTHCINGHAYAEAGWVKNGSSKTCAACRSASSIKRRRGGAHGTETHCPQGHPYSGDNLYIRSRGGRECRACTLVRNRAARRKRMARV